MANPVNDRLSELQRIYPEAAIAEVSRFGAIYDIEPGRKAATLKGIPFQLETREIVDTNWIEGTIEDPNERIWDASMVSDYLGFAFTDNFNRGQLAKYFHKTKTDRSLTLQPGDLVWSNQFNTSSWIGSPQGSSTAVVRGNSIRYNDCYKAGLDFEWLSLPAQFQKYFHINSLSELGSPPQWVIDGGNPHLKIQFLMEASPGIEIWIDGELWDEASRTITGRYVEFVDTRDGEVLWRFLWPQSYDADFASEEDNIRFAFQVSGSVLFVDVLVDWDWLQRANFPVVVDPSLNPVIGASSDDAEEGAGGDVNLTGATIRLQTANKWGGFRWTGVNIPVGSTIDVCYFEPFYVNPGRLTTDLNLYFENVDNAATFTTANFNISGRTKTGFVNWNETVAGTGYRQSPSLVSIMQTVVDRPGFAGDGVALLAEYGGSGDVQYRTYDANPAQAAELYVEWTEGAVPLDLTVNQDLRLTQTIIPETILDLIVTQDLRLLQNVAPELLNILELIVNQDLRLTQTIIPETILDFAVSHDLQLGQNVVLEVQDILELIVNQNLRLGQTVTPENLLDLIVNQDLRLGQNITPEVLGTLELIINQDLRLGQTIIPENISEMIIAQDLRLDQIIVLEVQDILELIVNQDLRLGQTIDLENIGELQTAQDLRLTQAVSPVVPQTLDIIINQQLGLIQIVSPQVGEVITPPDRIWIIPKEIRIWYIEENRKWIIENDKRIWII